ncbi:ABC transporter substrate-binding protein [Mongoliitalea daihaiensis]|uniref:ABC transporter substrate-binding protein n=1 Tax=Mongoliitalea daihaiensis TaxID=2782006 RepID=UPI001F1F7055|nr:ABC transporter substrate-binding protein [Mongoliitalea daihaiensis]UJP66681.1 ABC transporter substrate-binding protein [Mongoliitalea daihaiensis]
MHVLRVIFLCLGMLLFLLVGCTNQESIQNWELESLSLSYAEGFSVAKGDDFWVLTVSQAFPEAKESFRYLILEEGSKTSYAAKSFDAVIQLPVSEVLLTSTTHVPHLDYLQETDLLVGFPNLDLISSVPTRARIAKGLVKDLGNAPSANIELILEIAPDWMMVSTLGEDLSYLEILKKGGVPAVINGEYVEQHPLGRAEWIKFTGVLLGKWDDAVRVFEEIEQNYQETLALLTTQELAKPTVISGVMYKDIWYMPGADSWGARLLAEAGGAYLFKDQKGSGSSQLSYEVVLDRGQEAAYWIGAADFPNLQAMGEAEPRYRSFDAWKKGNIYTYTQKKGETGGLEYFELGYLRPDLIVKDLMMIFHPELFPGDTMYFYQKLDE